MVWPLKSYESYVAGGGWGRFRGNPPAHAFGTELWDQWRVTIEQNWGARRLREEESFVRKEAVKIQSLVRGVLCRQRRKPLSLQILASRVVVHNDIDLEKCRAIYPANHSILMLLQSIRHVERHVKGFSA